MSMSVKIKKSKQLTKSQPVNTVLNTAMKGVGLAAEMTPVGAVINAVNNTVNKNNEIGKAIGKGSKAAIDKSKTMGLDKMGRGAFSKAKDTSLGQGVQAAIGDLSHGNVIGAAQNVVKGEAKTASDALGNVGKMLKPGKEGQVVKGIGEFMKDPGKALNNAMKGVQQNLEAADKQDKQNPDYSANNRKEMAKLGFDKPKHNSKDHEAKTAKKAKVHETGSDLPKIDIARENPSLSRHIKEQSMDKGKEADGMSY